MSNNMKLPVQTGYKIKNDAYVKKVSKSNRDFDIEIGDTKQVNVFEPQVKITAFSNLSNLSMRYITKLKGKKNKTKKGTNGKQGKDKILYDLGDELVEFFETKDGVELNVILKSKPASNVFTFSLNYKDVAFYKQPNFDLMPPKEKAKYPPDIVQTNKAKGCYILLSTINRKQIPPHIYRHGHVATIFRPLITDASGRTTWGELNIDENTQELHVTVPQTFLNHATYPVVVDPEIGLSDLTDATEASLGAGGDTLCDSNAARHYTAGASEQIQNLTMHLRTTVAPGTPGSVTLGVYDLALTNDPNGGTLNTSASISPTNTASLEWLTTADVDSSITSGNNYAIALGNVVNPDVGVMKGSIISGGTQLARDATVGALPATFTHDNGSYSYMWAAYATVGSPPAAPVFSGTIADAVYARTSNISIPTASHFTDAGTFAISGNPAFIDIDTNTGVITNVGANVNGVYSGISVTCSNGQGTSSPGSNSFQITINSQAPVQTSSIGNKTGNVNSEITPVDTSLNFDFATSYAAVGLPAGLSIDSGTGIISGTPTSQFNYTGVYVTATNEDDSTNSSTFSWDIGAALPVPVITSVNSGNGLQRTKLITVLGSNLGSSGTVTFNGVSITTTTHTNTSITFTVPTGGWRFGIPYDLEVTNDSAYSGTYETTFEPQENYAYVTLAASYNQLPTNSIFYGEGGDYANIVVGVQCEYQTAASPEGTVVMSELGVVDITGATAAGDYTFSHGMLDIGDLTYSSNGTSVITLASVDGDIQSPNWVSSPAVPIGNVTTTQALATATISETGNIYVVVVLATANTPTSLQVKNGLDSLGASAIASASALGGTSLSETLTGLTEGTAYKFCFTAEDLESPPNLRGGATVVQRTTVEVADTTPPVFTTGPTVSQVTGNAAQLNAAIDESGTISWILVPQGVPAPSSSNVIQGEYPSPIDDNETEVALQSGSGSVITNLAITNLSPSTPYTVYFTAQDTGGNVILQPTGRNFTTSPAGLTRSVTDSLIDPVTATAVASTTVSYILQPVWEGAPTDTGELTTDGSGNFTITNLTAAAGSAYLTFKSSDDSKGTPPKLVTVTEA